MSMRGRHLDAYSMYKRGTREHGFDALDKEQGPERLLNGMGKDVGVPSWKHSLRHVLVATLSSFLYGYHLGVVNETLESISRDLGFHGNTMAEGLVVSTCLGGAFVGSLFSGLIADGVGRRRALQLCALPMIIGASMSAAAKSLWAMLLGRLFVGTGMGIGPAVAALYVTEVSPAYVRGTYGSFTQIATGLGLMGSLFIGFPAKAIEGWWRICFWASVAPAAILALFMEFSVESPHWLFKVHTLAFCSGVLDSLAVELKASKDFSKLYAGIAILGYICSVSDPINALAFSHILTFLTHRYPKIRKATAEQVYLVLLQNGSLVSEEKTEKALEIVSETCWDGDMETAKVKKLEVFEIVGLDVGVGQSKTTGNVTSNKGGRKSTTLDENESYSSLVESSGF